MTVQVGRNQAVHHKGLGLAAGRSLLGRSQADRKARSAGWADLAHSRAGLEAAVRSVLNTPSQEQVFLEAAVLALTIRLAAAQVAVAQDRTASDS